MNKHLQRVLALLKPKAASYGFSEEELKNVANTLCGGLTLKDEATPEETDAAINAQITAALPMLALAQSVANRVINKRLENQPTPPAPAPPAPEPPAPTKPEDVIALALQKLNERLDKTDAAIASLGQQRISDTRLERLNKVLEGTGTFAEMTRGSYGRLTFKDDADFESYLESVTNAAEEFKKGMQSTETLAAPPFAPQSWKGNEITEAEAGQIADFIH